MTTTNLSADAYEQGLVSGDRVADAYWCLCENGAAINCDESLRRIVAQAYDRARWDSYHAYRGQPRSRVIELRSRKRGIYAPAVETLEIYGPHRVGW